LTALIECGKLKLDFGKTKQLQEAYRMARPLERIRVLDLGRFIASPFCGLLLADLGAEVIRVERSEGGIDRAYGLLSPSGDNYIFVTNNRNKKAISLNFERNDKAKKILNELVKHSDVVIENFSPEAAEAMGITYDNLKAIKPDIIFAHVSAFGSTGPYSHRIGFDQVAKAMSGSMAVSGFPSTPTRDQVPWVDYSTATLTAVGILAALYHRQATGEGQMIETALLQTAVTFMAAYISEWETGKVLRQQVGNRSYWTSPVDLYKAKDGRWVMLAIFPDSIWRRFCRFIGREDLFTDPRFHNDLARWEHRHILDPVVGEWVASQTAEEVIAAAEKIPIPCGICHEQTEVANDPQVKAREMLTLLPSPDESGNVLVTGIPLRMSGTPLKLERSFPAIGQYNEEIYCGLLGYSHEDLAKLKEEGVI
jgi:crotonobetainyl-CoA:carnitine CoA-transferase CaiB-like acyl-CoA transferase